jgi:Na+/H+ antiporter NhaD/arsenite permease-like protein
LFTTLIFAATFLVLAIGRLPGFRIDRTGAAVIGAAFMVGTGALTMEQAWMAIHYDTILLLFGMMIVVANLRLSGFFRLSALWVMRHTHSPAVLLSAIAAVSALLSAFFVNDTICLVMTPLVLEVTLALERKPLAYLLAVAVCSNIGSVATITGNPQNMIVGGFSGIAYRDFAAALAPVAMIGLAIAVMVIRLAFRGEFGGHARIQIPLQRPRVNKAVLWKSLVASSFMIAAFFAGWPISKAALLAGAALLLTRRVKPEKVYRDIDFGLLVMFAGLFIVVAGMEKTALAADLIRLGSGLGLERIPMLAAFATLLSNLVSNVPAVLVFKPLIAHMEDPRTAWLTLAMSSTLAGNLTILGSVANLIVVEKARRECRIGFWDYFKVGFPVTLLSLAAGCIWLAWVAAPS